MKLDAVPGSFKAGITASRAQLAAIKQAQIELTKQHVARQEMIDRTGSFGRRAAGYGSAAIFGGAAAIGGGALETLTGSARLAAGELGIALTPAIIKVSGLFQEAAGVIRSINAATGGWLPTLAFGAVVTGLTTAAFSKLGGMANAASLFIAKKSLAEEVATGSLTRLSISANVAATSLQTAGASASLSSITSLSSLVPRAAAYGAAAAGAGATGTLLSRVGTGLGHVARALPVIGAVVGIGATIWARCAQTEALIRRPSLSVFSHGKSPSVRSMPLFKPA
ncbi:MAG: hypothetical protein L0Y72_21400 [Gemmataceae bacterium]|nr:hypothetical protein [Gemmataceae bacterium]MCI0741600.1 hypothetical protein [Gemmataceae bacterium]